MSEKIVKEYLKHILDEIDFVLEKSKLIDENRFMRDEMTKRAFVRSLEIIGEATKNIPDDFKKNYKKGPSRVGMVPFLRCSFTASANKGLLMISAYSPLK